MADGPEQVENFQKIFIAGISEDYFILRDRWHSEEDAGLKLTNRGGTHVGNQDPVVTDRPCHYPAYSMTIDWNGTYCCVQDWNKSIN